MKFIKTPTYCLRILTLVLSIISFCSFAGTENTGQIAIQGTSDVSFTGETHALASATGTFSALHANIKNSTQHEDGSIEHQVEHYVKLSSGGFFRTEDIAFLKPLKNQENKYQVDVTFTIIGASQGLSGYENQTFTGNGVFDLTTGTGIIHYSGNLVRHNSKS